MFTVQQAFDVLKTAIEQGRGEMPLVVTRGGEDETVYAVDDMTPGDYIKENAEIDGAMYVAFDTYEGIGTIADYLDDESYDDDAQNS